MMESLWERGCPIKNGILDIDFTADCSTLDSTHCANPINALNCGVWDDIDSTCNGMNIPVGETLDVYLNKPQYFQKQIELTFNSDDGSDFTSDPYEILSPQSSITYNFCDSNSGSENAPVYNWVEISDVGTNLGLTDDSHITDVGIGFGFPYYGEVFNSMTVCSNGWHSFLPVLMEITMENVILSVLFFQ